MNYFGIEYCLLNHAKKDEEIVETHVNYENNLLNKESKFPLKLRSIIFNQELYGLSMMAFGSLNLEIKNENNELKIQIPHSVFLENSSLNEFLLLNLSLSSNAKMKIVQYSDGNKNSITLEKLQELLKDQSSLCLRNISWDALEKEQIELNLNFTNNKDNQYIAFSIEFFEVDLLSARLRIPNYSDQDYIYLEQLGEDDVVGYNRIKKILNVFEQHFNNKQYVLI